MDPTIARMAPQPKKSLGQHWLHDVSVLADIADAAEILNTDTVLEVGPGLGTLTAELAKRAKHVIAIELDQELAAGLQATLHQQQVHNVTVMQADILRFDLSTLPPDYVIAANIPYYLTSHLLRILTETTNKPRRAVLLMQKEVAERVCAQPGDMSILAVAVQLHYHATLDSLVPARLFTPPPKVDSQVLVLERHNDFAHIDTKQLMRLVRISFAAKRKLLTNTLSAGYHIEKSDAGSLMQSAHIGLDRRAEQLTMDEWIALLQAVQTAQLS